MGAGGGVLFLARRSDDFRSPSLRSLGDDFKAGCELADHLERIDSHRRIGAIETRGACGFYEFAICGGYRTSRWCPENGADAESGEAAKIFQSCAE